MATIADLEALVAEAAAIAPDPDVPGEHRWPFTPHGADWGSEKADATHEPDPRWDEFQEKQSEWTAQLPQQADALVSVPYEKGDPTVVERCLAALGRDGAVILTGAVSAETCDQVVADMAPYTAAASLLGGFYGKKTKRVGALPARSRACDPIIAHPVLMKLMDACIGRQVLRMDTSGVQRLARKPSNHRKGGLKQLPWNLDLSQIIQLAPGSEEQPLHHDGGYCLWDFHNICEHKISTVWALSDFTDEAGATRVVVGSHLWDRSRTAQLQDSVPAVMPKGSVVIYLASCLHGSGPNRTLTDTRIGLNVDYNMALLKTEENQYLSVPPSVAYKIPVYMQKLCGYTRRGSTSCGAGSSVCKCSFVENLAVSQRIVKTSADGFLPRNAGSFCDFQHPKDALDLCSPGGFEGQHRVDWARPERGEWQGYSADPINEKLIKIADQPWRWRGWRNADDTPDPEVPSDIMLAHVEPDERWTNLAMTKNERIAALPDGLQFVSWNPTNAESISEQLVTALCRDGAVVLLNAVSEECADSVCAEMAPYLDAAFERAKHVTPRNGAQQLDPATGKASETTRVDALPARSNASWEMIMHPALMDVCEAMIGCQLGEMSQEEMRRRMLNRAKQVPWQMHLSQIIRVEPNCGAQGLHRDGGYLEFNFDETVAPLEHEISTIWSLNDFTQEIGATRVVPGSHRWPQHRAPLDEESVPAVMPKGSVVIYTSHCYHSAGANLTDTPRMGLNIDYNAGFVAEEEIQVLSAPPDVARHFPKKLQVRSVNTELALPFIPETTMQLAALLCAQRLCGYDCHSTAISYYGDWQHPIQTFDLKPVDWAASYQSVGAVASKM